MAHADAQAVTHDEGQQHPLGIYFKIWGWLFVLSAGSYAVDYFHLEGMLRWSLILIFMAASMSGCPNLDHPRPEGFDNCAKMPC